MKKQTFLSGVLILFVAGVIAKILGAVYRIPLTWLLGAKGLGMYQLVYPLFSLILVLSSAGMPTAISKVTAEFVKIGDKLSARATLKISLQLLLAISGAFAIILSVGAWGIASLQGNPNLYICYLGLVPAVILVSILSAFRGYFQGGQNMVPTATSQLIEQSGKLFFGLILGYLLLPFGVEFGTFGALLGVSVSELLATATMLIFYKKSLKLRKSQYNSAQNELHSILHSTENHTLSSTLGPLLKNDKTNVVRHFCNKNQNLCCEQNEYKICNLDIVQSTLANPEFGYKRVFKIKQNTTKLKLDKYQSRRLKRTIIKNFIPITLSNAILPFVLFIESMFVILLLLFAGLDTTTATTLWGINSGVVGSLVNMPLALTQAVAIAMVPAIVSESSKLNFRYNQAFGLSLTLCVPIIIVFLLLGEPIITILYRTTLNISELVLATRMLAVMSISVLFGALLQTQNSLIFGLGYGKVIILNMSISALIQIVLYTTLCMSALNIWGCVIASIVFYATAYALNYIFIRKKLRITIRPKTVLPSLAGGVMLTFFIINITLLNLSEVLSLGISIVGGGVLYLMSLYVWGGLETVLALKKVNMRV